MPRRFVSYLKVRTDRQGRSGLGLTRSVPQWPRT